MSPHRPIAVHLVGGTPDEIAGAISARTDLRLAPDREAEVWLAPAHRPLASWPAQVAVLAVGGSAEAWGLTPPDLSVSPEQFAADARGALERAIARRLAFRPAIADRCEDWLEGIRQALGADVAAWHDRTGTTVAGEGEHCAFGTAVSGAPWLETGPAARAKLGGRSGVEGAAALPIEARERGVLIVAVRSEGPAFVRSCGGPLREIALAASNVGMVAELESTTARTRWLEGLLRGALSIASHDLRNAQFGLQIGVRLLGRYPEATPTVGNLRGSVEEPLKTVQRMVGGVRELLDGPQPAGTGPTPLREAWARVLEQITGKFSHPVIDGGAPDLELAVGSTTFETLAYTLVRNAVPHGPVQVEWQTTDTQVRMAVRNPGTLPFRELARLTPFEHRAAGGAGLGLCVARAAAQAAGIGLRLQQENEHVLAELLLPRAVASAP
jgi:hypothetical protein